MKHLVLGGDPGFTGALALVSALWPGEVVDWIDTPIVRHRGRKHQDLHAVARWVRAWEDQILLAMLETPGPREGEGPSRSFRFGRTCGEVAGILEAREIVTFPCVPSVWKDRAGVSADKGNCCDVAARLFPASRGIFRGPKNGPKDGRAEAVLLANLGLGIAQLAVLTDLRG